MRHDETKPQLHMKRSSRPWPAANHGKPQPQKSEPVRIPIDPSLSQERSQAIAVNSPAVETQSPESHATSFESVLSSLADPMPSDPKPMKPEVEAAARKIQFTWRSRAARRTALSRIAALRSQYDSIRDSFALPEHPDFARSPSGSPSPSPRSSISHPPLLYTKTNAPILAHEEALTRLLTKLDAVESNGDHKVRNARRALAKDVEKHSNDLELQMSLKWDELSRSESENECAVDDSEMDAENDHEAQVLAPEGGFEPLAAPAEGPNSTVSENGTVPAPQGEITKHSSSLPSKLDDSPAAHSEDSMVESDISLARDSTVSSDSDSDSDRQDEWDEMVVELGINPEEDWVDVQTE
ncbi:uncharacterized protein EI90DRAFT_257379 [Cantharellus anzutake]|uniref:uncharacterized protein n=1 Tax=Cantharellus anzutake TaxID=1750568 RepID=UPI0019045527|nr:uncharacterized protein EI90DRAFT_257379 [Cantharellus anzutake]KAF8335783.1 hypothetical protein EI90DRAFT_257379 [Cantharellus anzutake]